MSFHPGTLQVRGKLDFLSLWQAHQAPPGSVKFKQLGKQGGGEGRGAWKIWVFWKLTPRKHGWSLNFWNRSCLTPVMDFWGAFVMVPSFFGWHMEIDPSNKELNIWLWWILEIYLQIDLPNPSQSLLVIWTLQSLPLQHSSYVILFVVVTLRIMKMTIWWFCVSKKIF